MCWGEGVIGERLPWCHNLGTPCVFGVYFLILILLNISFGELDTIQNELRNT
jgi:hypothetical protein